MSDQESSSVWITSYSPNGFKVSLTLKVGQNPQDVIAAAIELEQFMLENGYAPNEYPEESELKPGEEIRPVTHLLRTLHVNEQTGEETPVVVMYYDHHKWENKVVHKYLNSEKPEDTEQLLKAARLDSLDQIPFFEFTGNYPNKQLAFGRLGALKVPEFKIVCFVKSPDDQHKFGRVYLNRYVGQAAPQQSNADVGENPTDNLNEQRFNEDKWLNWGKINLAPEIGIFQMEDLLDCEFDDWYNDYKNNATIADNLRAAYAIWTQENAPEPTEPEREISNEYKAKLKNTASLKSYQKDKGYSWNEILNAAGAVWRENPELTESDTRQICKMTIERVDSHKQ